MWGRSLDRGFSTLWRVFLAPGGASSCSASLRLFALDRASECPACSSFCRSFVALGQVLTSLPPRSIYHYLYQNHVQNTTLNINVIKILAKFIIYADYSELYVDDRKPFGPNARPEKPRHMTSVEQRSSRGEAANWCTMPLSTRPNNWMVLGNKR